MKDALFVPGQKNVLITRDGAFGPRKTDVVLITNLPLASPYILVTFLQLPFFVYVLWKHLGFATSLGIYFLLGALMYM